MRKFYVTLLLFSVLAANTLQAQTPAKQPQTRPQPGKQTQTNTGKSTQPAKQTQTTNNTSTQSGKQTQSQTNTSKPAQSGKQTPKQTATTTDAKSTTHNSTHSGETAEEYNHSKPSAVDDTVGVVLHADARLALLTYTTRHDNPGQVVNGRRTGAIYSGRGFRVQIYSGNDRNVATQRKIDFIRRFPGTRTYMTYIAPTFRVKVGDFRDRKAAQVMYQQASKLYNPCMIVNDIIEINTFRQHD